MQLEHMTVQLRTRSGFEALELGTALVRRHAAAIWKPWLLVTLPLLALANLVAWSLDAIWAAWLLMWWLKPAFDRIPLFVISRAVFGATPGTRETLVAQLHWGWRSLLHLLTWRRLGPARSLLMPIDLLEGGHGARLRERRSVLGGAAYGTAALLTLVCLHFELALVLGCVAMIFLFVPFEYLPETARAAWSLVTEQPPWWAQIGFNLFAWVAVSVIEPFFVGAGFGLYLNRRTQIEAWDVEIAFRRLRARLLAAAAPLALAVAMLLVVPGLRAQERHAPPQDNSAPAQATQAPAPPTLPVVFGEALADEGGFERAADRAYEDPLLDSRRRLVTWERRDRAAQEPPQAGPPWLQKLVAALALLGEWGLWIVAGVLVLVLALTARHWLPWMRGGLRRSQPVPTGLGQDAVKAPEALPADVAGAARALWAQGQPRQALALLYRASVHTMSVRAQVVLPPGATEAQCLRASRRMPEADDRGLFAQVVRTWQYAAYGQRLPPADEFEALLVQLQQRYGWGA